ncbi:hypothetical protein C4A75_12155 [Brevibacillus laterosporus]|nr:hypothetical protein C4A75_12155 [Brevibacillus laterosporus]
MKIDCNAVATKGISWFKAGPLCCEHSLVNKKYSMRWGKYSKIISLKNGLETRFYLDKNLCQKSKKIVVNIKKWV